jgi:myosin-6
MLSMMPPTTTTIPSATMESSPTTSTKSEFIPSDLSKLSELNYATILSTLKLRYNQNKIYTNISDTLLAINPYRDIPQLFSRDTLLLYALDAPSTSNPEDHPHVFSIARKAYFAAVGDPSITTTLTKPRSQAIIISGQSGSGLWNNILHLYIDICVYI